MTKYIFVTGGVVSGLGKGITAASLGRLLKARGLKVAAQKLDPYINVDPGTMSPYQHGEVYVTEDGAETDLDLGHYERFIDEDLNKYSNLTTGKVYWNVLNKERRGEYLGETVQVIPHITNEIKDFIYSVGSKTNADVVITEVGGTTGDIESQPFLEAIRQVGLEVGRENALYIHVTLVPYLHGSEEHKTKPTQHSVKELQGMGISPDIIVLRCDEPLEESIFRKISLFCNVKPDCVIENMTIPVLYEAPVMLEKNRFSEIVCRELHIDAPAPDMTEWDAMLESIRSRSHRVTIGLVGKYVQLHDAYLSVAEALRHAGYVYGTRVDIQWIDSETITRDNVEEVLGSCDGILVPGGFGNRGIEGKIAAAHYARTHNIPYLGICLGMQIAVIEFARSVCGLADANSGEFDEGSTHKVIDFMPDQSDEINKGGTLRLGAYPCHIVPGTKMAECYGTLDISERHRHRYEFNNDYRALMQEKGLVLSGLSPDGHIVETVEIPENDFYIGVQYHPEFKSRPNKAHPLFKGLISAALRHAERISMHDRYVNPLCTRYAGRTMQHIYSDDNKFSTWRRLWVALAESEQELGLPITDEQIRELRAHITDIDYDYAAAREHEVRHDVMAHVLTYGACCPEAKPILHLGATSCYVGDNTDIILMREALEQIRSLLVNVIQALADFAEAHKAEPTLAYTHFQAAQPTTVGKRATLWTQDLLMDLEQLEFQLGNLKLLGCKGTTGTGASFLALFDGDEQKVVALEQKICEKMGFPGAYPVSGQTYSRKVDFQVLQVLSGIAQSASKFSSDIRLLSHLKEVDEPFESGQIGSSAMAYKRNPMRSERIASLSRYVICDLQNAAVTASAQWFERTLDDSANRRISIPEAFLATDGILTLYLNVIRGLTVYPKMAEKHLADELPFLATENILMYCVKEKGGDRQALHEAIRQHSVAAGKEVKLHGGSNDLLERILADPIFGLTRAELNKLVDPHAFTGMAVHQTETFLREQVAPVLNKYTALLGCDASVNV